MHSTPIPAPRSNTEQSGNTDGQQPNTIVNTDLNSPSSATESQSNEEPIYATIPERSNQDQQKATKRNNSTETESSEPWNESLINPLPKPKRSTSLSQDAASSTSLDSKISNPPSYESESGNKKDSSSKELQSLIPSSNTNTNSLSKLKAKLGYPVQQRAFVIFSTALVTFLAAYIGLVSKHLKSISSFKNPSLYIPIIVASVLAALSIVAFIWNFKDTRIKKTSTKDDKDDKDDSKIFSTMKGLENEKCIKSIELKLSNNTNYTLLDSSKYKTLAFKKLELTLKRPLISAEIAAFVTITATYLLTKCFEMGYENLANSLENFNTGNAELMAFTITAGAILVLLIGSLIHYYRKTYVEELNITTDPKKIESYNQEYIKEAELNYEKKDNLSSGKHSKGKVASLTIDQAKIEYYNSKILIIAAA